MKAIFGVTALLILALTAGVVARRRAMFNPSDRPRPAGDASELDGLRRDELYELARKAELQGRSQMTKDELKEALAP